MNLNELSYKVLGCAITVHKEIGPGMLESVYERALCKELELQGLNYRAQVPTAIQYKGTNLDIGFKMDILVEDQVVVEIKSVDAIAPVHKAQILSYLRATKLTVGLLINFNVANLQQGIRRVVYQFEEDDILPQISAEQ